MSKIGTIYESSSTEILKVFTDPIKKLNDIQNSLAPTEIRLTKSVAARS